MAMEITNNYSAYENTYAAQKKGAGNPDKTAAGNTEVKQSAVGKYSNEEYLKNLQKQVPYMKLQIGQGINLQNDGKVNIVDINPKLLEKMQNDPAAAKEYTQRLKDVERALKFADNFSKSMGHTVVCSHSYIDENGKFSHFAVVVKKDLLNEKLRKEAEENAKKQIEKTRENARKKTEQLTEQLEEKAEEAKEAEKEKEPDITAESDALKDNGATQPDALQDKAEQMLLEKLNHSDNGEIYIDDEEMQLIIQSATEDEQGRSDKIKNPVVSGNNFDMQV